MKIKCEKCGNKINLDESLKNLIRDEALEEHDKMLRENHQQEIKKIQKDFEDSLQSRETLIEENFIAKLKLMEERNSEMKEKEISLEKQNMILEEKAKEAALVAEKESRELLKRKEAELDLAKEEEFEIKMKEYQTSLTNEMESIIREKELENQRLIKEAEDARARLNHANNSQELVGEAAEMLLLERLRSTFTFDEFEEIKKGQQGADIFQIVCNKSGENFGSILYECKKTKRWSEGWVAKFKDDIRKKGATVGILVSEALPDYCNGNDAIFKNGIWITSPKLVLLVAAAASKEIHSVYKAKTIKAGKASLEGAVYDYITGDEFIERFKAIAETYIAQLDDLEREERALKKSWRIRRKQIDKSQTNLVEIFGDLEALSDGNIKSLEDFQLSLD